MNIPQTITNAVLFRYFITSNLFSLISLSNLSLYNRFYAQQIEQLRSVCCNVTSVCLCVYCDSRCRVCTLQLCGVVMILCGKQFCMCDFVILILLITYIPIHVIHFYQFNHLLPIYHLFFLILFISLDIHEYIPRSFSLFTSFFSST